MRYVYMAYKIFEFSRSEFFFDLKKHILKIKKKNFNKQVIGHTD